MVLAAEPPHIIIVELTDARVSWTDREILNELDMLAPFKDENDPAWNVDAYWHSEVYRFLALANESYRRRLAPAIKMLLDRASFGDPGEIMRGLRHYFEGIVKSKWNFLADICHETCETSRLGTRLWALNQLVVLEDSRSRKYFEDAIAAGVPEIVNEGKIRLKRLDHKEPLSNPMNPSDRPYVNSNQSFLAATGLSVTLSN